MPDQMLKTLVESSGMIDQVLSGMADMLAETGGPEIAQARELIKAGVGKFLAAHGATGASAAGPGGGPSPGAAFPGGGFTSI